MIGAGFGHRMAFAHGADAGDAIAVAEANPEVLRKLLCDAYGFLVLKRMRLAAIPSCSTAGCAVRYRGRRFRPPDLRDYSDFNFSVGREIPGRHSGVRFLRKFFDRLGSMGSSLTRVMKSGGTHGAASLPDRTDRVVCQLERQSTAAGIFTTCFGPYWQSLVELKRDSCAIV